MKGHSTTNQQKGAAAKAKARGRRVRRAHNILVNNVSPEERARRRGESTVQASRGRVNR